MGNGVIVCCYFPVPDYLFAVFNWKTFELTGWCGFIAQRPESEANKVERRVMHKAPAVG